VFGWTVESISRLSLSTVCFTEFICFYITTANVYQHSHLNLLATCIYKSRFNYVMCVVPLYFGIIDFQIARLNMLCNICQCFECWNGAFDALCFKVPCYLLILHY
jgi:hypothetical protein